jgi:hypothetical protein
MKVAAISEVRAKSVLQRSSDVVVVEPAGSRWGTHPPVFWAKSVDLLDSKGVEIFGDDKEFAIV